MSTITGKVWVSYNFFATGYLYRVFTKAGSHTRYPPAFF